MRITVANGNPRSVFGVNQNTIRLYGLLKLLVILRRSQSL